jgi:ornithine carbamoyltransferase
MIMEAGSMQLGRGETIADTARVLSRMVDAIMIRTHDHAKIEELAHHADVPVINGLTDHSHPCQIMADLLTVIERGFALPGLEVAWLGDGNNVLNSIVEAAGLMRFHVRIGVPQGYDCDAGLVEAARRGGARISIHRDAREAVAGASVVITDTWISMGQSGAEERVAAMSPFQVNPGLMSAAAPDALFLHCLPAHRGEEVTDEVIDGPQSAVWDEAENRIHAQKSVLLWTLGPL